MNPSVASERSIGFKSISKKGVVIPWNMLWKVAVAVFIAGSGYYWFQYENKVRSVVTPIVRQEMTNSVASQLKPFIDEAFEKAVIVSDSNTVRRVTEAREQMRQEFVSKTDFREFREDQKKIVDAVQQMRVDLSVLTERVNNQKQKP